jgi:hypothetical protein
MLQALATSKAEVASLEARVAALTREKAALTEELSETRAAAAKLEAAHAAEAAELRRERLQAMDSMEAERARRVRSEAEEAAARRAEEEDRRQLAEARHREEAVQRRLKDNEDEGHAWRQTALVSRSAADAKETQRQEEVDRRRALEVEVSKLQLQVEGAARAAAEWRERYDALRREGKGVRQQLHEVVHHAADTLQVSAPEPFLSTLVFSCSYNNRSFAAVADVSGPVGSRRAGPRSLGRPAG